MDRIVAELAAFFSDHAPLFPGDRLLVAFSGGPDSLALLVALRTLAESRRFSLHALHLDHAMDPGSTDRAGAAVRLADRLGVPISLARRAVVDERRHGESLEEAARRIRYAELELCRDRIGARWIATAHHRDDQLETVLLRLLSGSGWQGLSGIAPIRGSIVRPLLVFSRRELQDALRRATDEAPRDTLRPVLDPTNDLAGAARNRLRRDLLPVLTAREGELAEVAAALSAAARGARAALSRRLAPALAPEGIALAWLLELPLALRREALRLASGRDRGGPGLRTTALAELERQLDRPIEAGSARARCDAGGGLAWEARGGRLRLAKTPETTGDFSYTVAVPGWVEVPQAAGRIGLRLATGNEATGSRSRQGVLLRQVEPTGTWSVRSRRPGDRLRPRGAPGTRKLKELLIDRKVPREERSRLPLLCCQDEIVWVPGVTVADGWQAVEGEPAWLAEWERT